MTNRKFRKQAAKLRRAKRRARYTFEEAVAKATGGRLIYRDGWDIRLSCHHGPTMVVDHTAPNPIKEASIRRYVPTPDDIEATDWRTTMPKAGE